MTLSSPVKSKIGNAKHAFSVGAGFDDKGLSPIPYRRNSVNLEIFLNGKPLHQLLPSPVAHFLDVHVSCIQHLCIDSGL